MAHISQLHASTFTALEYVETATAMTNVADALTIFGEIVDDIVNNAGDLESATSTAVLKSGTAITDGTDTAVLTADLTLSSSGATPSFTGTLPTGTIQAVYADGATVVSVGNIREFPSLGTPANIVNVPVYGQSVSAQVSGQSDAPSLEFTLNYIPTEHAALDALRVSGAAVAFRVRLASAEAGLRANAGAAFDDFYFKGTVASMEITPALNDSTQATLALTINTDFFGPASLVGTTYGTV